MSTPVERCPHCGNEEGFYTKDFSSGAIRTRYNFDGTEADNTELYSGLRHKMGKKAHCSKCDKVVFDMSEYEA
ncbi:hypothetical protein JOE49_004007 [Paenibacillus sp. PvR133]|jgi:hypothetical protein|uniref:hypothetical protein n=1 Tax=Paenibacillus sp. PvR133 TaxID=2806598 RepID=UPI001AE8F4C9|nr:hypothetical protein [Paenibacillus sp. PvR133]MBP1176755.1 hypothetical protein [Paenibacillus sp. PvR133]